MVGTPKAQTVVWAAFLLVHDPLARATPGQIAVFFPCYSKKEPQSVRSLARRLGIARPRVSAAMRILESWSLLARATDPTDVRGVIAEQTKEGLALIAGSPHRSPR
jgi:DNA-binding MarR family transcriptional regulator